MCVLVYFLTFCVNNFSGKRGRRWGEVNVGRQFPASFRKYFETNRIFSVALVYCDKMSTIASLGVKEEIKNILDSGEFFRDVQQYFQRKFPHKCYGISRRSVRRYCQANGLQRYSSKRLNKTAAENVIKRASEEVKLT